MKKIYKRVIGAVVIIVILALIIPIPIPISKTISAVEINRLDKSFCVPVSITINGTYTWKAFAADTFRGDISFDTYSLTLNEPLVQTNTIPALTLYGGSDTLDYGEFMNSEIFGRIITRPFFRSFVVAVMEKVEHNDFTSSYSWDTENGHCIVGNTTNREDAVRIVKDFSNNEFLSPFPESLD